MISADTLVAAVVAVPLLGAIAALLLPRAASCVVAVVAALNAAAVVLLVRAVAAGGPVRHAPGGWGAPLGIELEADGLAAVLLVTITVVSAAINLYASAHRPWDAPRRSAFHGVSLLVWASLDALVLSRDVFNLYVTLELTTLSMVALVALTGRRAAIAAALRYLLLALVGSLGYLLGVALLYGRYGVLDLDALAAVVRPGAATWVAIALMVVGLALKAGLFPLHVWMPSTYAATPAPVSALFAALIGKASFVVLLRLAEGVIPAALLPAAGDVLGALGACGVAWGSLLALRQERLKHLLASSSVAQVGYLFLLFPLATADARLGVVVLLVAHALAKGAMFLAAGTVAEVAGHDRIAGLRGLAQRQPLTFFALALAGITLIGLPPSGGFVAKWFLVRSGLETGAWWWAAVVLVGGLLAAGYVFRILRTAFLPPSQDMHVAPPSRRLDAAALALALASLALGLAPRWPLALLAVGAP